MQIHPEINNITGDFTSVIPLEINFEEEKSNEYFKFRSYDSNAIMGRS